MNQLKISVLLIFLIKITLSVFASEKPLISNEALLIKAEKDPQVRLNAYHLAESQNLPTLVYLPGGEIIQALDIEDGKVVYSVITNHAHPFMGGKTLFYDELINLFNLNTGKIYYANGNFTDNTHGMFDPVLSPRTSGLLLLVPDWTLDKVIAFDAVTGNIVDTSFIPTTSPQLQSPKEALQTPWGTILVSDQISDVVQEFDTSGAYIGVFAPAGGPNTSLVDNMRGIAFRPNNNLLITVASGASQNTVQEFDTGGVSIGTFIAGMSSPFDIMYRTGNILVSGSSSPDVNMYDTLGTFLSTFFNGSQISFAQQMLELPNGDIAVAGFSTPSGIIILSSTGTYIRTLTGVSGNRSIYQLPNGNFLTTNSTGIHEIDDTTGALVRTIMTGANFQYIDVYDPNLVVGKTGSSIILPKVYKLYENFPNPFNPSTSIKFSLPEKAFVKLVVYDVLGKEIKTLVNRQMNAGTHEVKFNAEGIASGIYFCKITANEFSEVKKMILTK
jgi:hypothetical protein